MTRFEIRDDFYLDGKSFKILSGAIHYFRVPPEDWYHSLYNLKALGFNTVETYIAWNLHEPREGEFHFDGDLDLEISPNSAGFGSLRNCASVSIYLCGMGIRWLTSLALDQEHANSLIRPSIYRGSWSLL